MSEELGPRGHEGMGAQESIAHEHRRALRPLLVNLDVLLEMLGKVEGYPARRAHDRALREAIREARPALAKLRAAVERMEAADREAGGAQPTDQQGA